MFIIFILLIGEAWILLSSLFSKFDYTFLQVFIGMISFPAIMLATCTAASLFPRLALAIFGRERRATIFAIHYCTILFLVIFSLYLSKAVVSYLHIKQIF